MGTLSVRDQNTLDQIARMAWGSSEGAKGGRGNIGIIKDEYGRSRIIKTDTHLFGSKTANGDKADLVAASNELRTTLVRIARSINLEQEVMREIRDLLSMPGDDTTVDTPLKRRAVAQVVSKIDSTVWQRATTSVNMKDFSSSRCDTDYKSVSKTNASEGKASRVIQKPWDPVWRRLSTVSPNALVKAVDIKFGELLDKHFGDRIRNFYKGHQKASIVDGKTVGREDEYNALKNTIDNFEEIAVGQYYCCSDDRDRAQKLVKEKELFRSLADNLSEDEMKTLNENTEGGRNAIADKYVRENLEKLGIKQDAGNGNKTEVAIKAKVVSFSKFLQLCVGSVKEENGSVKKINKDMLSQATLKVVCGYMMGSLRDSILQGIERGVVKNTGEKDGKPDEYANYRNAYSSEHPVDEYAIDYVSRGFTIVMRLPSDSKGLLDPSKREEAINTAGLDSGVNINFCSKTSDDYKCKVSTEGVIHETKWVMDNLFELANPGADDQAHLDFVNQTVDELLKMANKANG